MERSFGTASMTPTRGMPTVGPRSSRWNVGLVEHASVCSNYLSGGVPIRTLHIPPNLTRCMPSWRRHAYLAASAAWSGLALSRSSMRRWSRARWGTVDQKCSALRVMYSPGTSGFPASSSRRRITCHPDTLSCFLAGWKCTPARRNSSAIDPAPLPVRAKIASSATPWAGAPHRLHIDRISSLRIGTVQPRPSLGRSLFTVASSSRITLEAIERRPRPCARQRGSPRRFSRRRRPRLGVAWLRLTSFARFVLPALRT